MKNETQKASDLRLRRAKRMGVVGPEKGPLTAP